MQASFGLFRGSSVRPAGIGQGFHFTKSEISLYATFASRDLSIKPVAAQLAQ
jgi:hypothetical protein